MTQQWLTTSRCRPLMMARYFYINRPRSQGLHDETTLRREWLLGEENIVCCLSSSSLVSVETADCTDYVNKNSSVYYILTGRQRIINVWQIGITLINFCKFLISKWSYIIATEATVYFSKCHSYSQEFNLLWCFTTYLLCSFVLLTFDCFIELNKYWL